MGGKHPCHDIREANVKVEKEKGKRIGRMGGNKNSEKKKRINLAKRGMRLCR